MPDEIVIVDNYDDLGACHRAVRGMPPRSILRIVRPAKPVGTATGRNLALEAATSDLCLLLDDDVTIHDPTAIAQLAAMFAAPGSQDLAAVTVRVRAFGSAAGLASRAFRRLYDYVKLPFFLRASRPGGVSLSHFQSDMTSMHGSGPVSWLQGGAAMVRREMAVEVGFDAHLELAPLAIAEDVDFGFRLSRRHRIEYRADVETFNGHDRSGGMGAAWLTPRQKTYITVRNLRYLARKNLPGRKSQLASWWSLCGVGLYLAAVAIVRHDLDSRESLRGWFGGMIDAARLHESDRPSGNK